MSLDDVIKIAKHVYNLLEIIIINIVKHVKNIYVKIVERKQPSKL